MKVREVMVSPVVTCTDRAVLADAVKLMWEHDIGFVPVVSPETGALAGVITDRDACIAAWFQGKSLQEIPVRTAMSTRVSSCRPDADVDEAEVIMSEIQVHRLPVVSEAGKLVGVVSINDLARRAAGDADEELEGEVALTLGAISQPRQTTAGESH
jgi:CBS domain-containing protein